MQLMRSVPLSDSTAVRPISYPSCDFEFNDGIRTLTLTVNLGEIEHGSLTRCTIQDCFANMW